VVVDSAAALEARPEVSEVDHMRQSAHRPRADPVLIQAAVSIEEDKEVEVSRRLLVAPPPAPSSPAVTIGVEEEEQEEAMTTSAGGGAEEEEAVAPAAAKRIRLFAYCSASPAAAQQKNWGGAVPAKKARRAPKKTIKKMCVALPVGDGDSATLAHGALVYGMVP
jgi:hypothetical protein